MSAVAKKKEQSRAPFAGGMHALFRKELADHVESRRFYLILIMLLVIGTASVSGAIQTIRTSGGVDADYMYLNLFTLSGSSLYSFNTFLDFLGPLIGIMLGFDAINTERSQGTLNRLAAQPIYRDAIINAKFLAGAVVVFALVYSVGLLVFGAGIVAIGTVPTLEEAARIVIYLFFAAVYISLWLAFSLLLSVVCRYPATAALICLAVWLFMTLFFSLVVSAAAGAIFPLSGYQGMLNAMKNYSFQLAANRISPSYLFTEVSTTLLNPNVRSTGLVTVSQASGAIAGYLPLSQSILLVWPHLTALCAEALVCFGISYVAFMRQELRA